MSAKDDTPRAAVLAPYAVDARQSLGRVHAEPPPVHRSQFQRDRDRIVHASAFRRLEYKTQVFVNHEGDMFRTRLTHSLEVAQIARTIARALAINEDLTEAIALAHDVGHTPFGHAGQEALNTCMRDFGGFEHNLHSLRVVDVLEERYPQFPGLNLLFETREGIVKHCSIAHARDLGRLGERFLQHRQPCLEAQIANVADEIAYNHHDIDDGLRSNLLDIGQLESLAVFAQTYADIRRRYPRAGDKLLAHATIREMLNFFVVDLVDASAARLAAAGVQTVEEVRARAAPLIDFSAPIRTLHLELKRLLKHHLYDHYRVQRMARKAHQIVRELFAVFMDTPALLPHDYAAEAGCDPATCARAITDYIAGMTDRFAIAEYGRIFTPGQVT